MKKRLVQKNKSLFITAGMILLVIITYKFGISRTIEQVRLHAQLNESRQKTTYEDVSDSQIQSMSQQLSPYRLDTLNPAKNLLGLVCAYCENTDVQLTSYKPVSDARMSTFTLLTREITIEGSFTECLQLVYDLEVRHKAGKVSSVRFSAANNKHDKSRKLYCFITVQNIVTHEL